MSPGVLVSEEPICDGGASRYRPVPKEIPSYDCNSNMKILDSILILGVGCGLIACKKAEETGDTKPQSTEELVSIAETYGQFAPDDAWVDDPDFAFYGSENQWSRRQFSAVSAELLYKRRGQRQLLEILDGNIDEAIFLAEFRLEEDATDAESWFILTVAYSQKNDIRKGMETMQRALENGMEFGRFLAGPRDLLEPLTVSTEFQTFARSRAHSLIHGPMVGSVSESQASFWVRTVGEDRIEILCYDGDSKLVSQGSSRAVAEADYTAVVHVENLKADSEYRYDVLVNGELVSSETPRKFRTYRSSDTAGMFKIGVGGCAGYTPKYEYMWSTLASRELDAMLMLGDNVYIDIAEMPGAFHDYSYYRRQSQPDFRKLVQTTPLYAIWDDHDAAIDDIWMGPYRDKPVWKQPMVNLFNRNWVNPGTGTADWPGCWFQFSMGDVDVFMLDGRTYRTNPYKDEKTMLGPVQKKWLLEGLKASKATFKIIASPVAWASESKPGSNDTWNGFINEREEIFQYLGDNRIEGVILLSGDRHRTDFWMNERGEDYPLYEMMSCRLTNIHTHDLMPEALFGYNELPSFGILNFNTEIEDPEVRFEVVNIDNQLIHSHTLKRSELSY